MTAAIVLVRAVIMIALIVVSMSVSVRRPGRKRIRETPPGLRAACHFLIGQQTTIELTLERVSINAESHDRERLPAIAEWFLPFFSRAIGHLGSANMRIARGPPKARGGALELRSGKIKTAHFIHPGSEPEETFRAKESW